MQAHQTKLDVIGNNIANVNTYGFKSSRARFQDVYYQTLQSATGGDNNKGGTNASQVGYGAQLAGVDLTKPDAFAAAMASFKSALEQFEALE